MTSGDRGAVRLRPLGDSVTQTHHLAYARVRTIDWEGVYYREDIG